MKKTILILLILTASLLVNAQSTEKEKTKKTKMEHSFAWGLFKSKNYPKDKTAVLEVAKPKFSNSKTVPLDTANYEKKSVLWNAIQWTVKKNETITVKPQNNEN